MAYCRNCGTQIGEDVNFCPNCGAGQKNDAFGGIHSGSGDDAKQNKAVSIFAYLWILFLVPLFAAKDSPFARYHTNQGIVLFIFSTAYQIVSFIAQEIFYVVFWRLGFVFERVFDIFSLVFLALVIIGIVNVCKGETKPLPVIGGITILK